MTQALEPEDLTPGQPNNLLRGPQPAWMDDIRCAMLKIQTARLRARANRLDIRVLPDKSVELPRDKAGALRDTVSGHSIGRLGI